jgi:hypothetical protein
MRSSIVIGRPEGKGLFERVRHRWKDNTKTNLEGTECDQMS